VHFPTFASLSNGVEEVGPVDAASQHAVLVDLAHSLRFSDLIFIVLSAIFWFLILNVCTPATQIGDWYDVVIPGMPTPPPVIPADTLSDVCNGKETGIVVRPFHSEMYAL
jgi:hypothetical protein